MSRTLPPFDPNFKFEDSLILGLVKLLELDWFQFLNDTQRAAWRTHWLTVSPMDIKRHVYTTGTASATGETHVEEERCYAWSQIYGVQRLQRAPVVTPSTTGAGAAVCDCPGSLTGQVCDHVRLHGEWPDHLRRDCVCRRASEPRAGWVAEEAGLPFQGGPGGAAAHVRHETATCQWHTRLLAVLASPVRFGRPLLRDRHTGGS